MLRSQEGTCLPPYRSRYSKHQFTQPQLLAVLCLMRYKEWTFRKTEVRLREHGELRRVLRLSIVPDSTTLYRFLERLEEDHSDEARGAASRFFVRRMYHHAQQPLPWRHWLKWLVTWMWIGNSFCLRVPGPWNDCARLRPLVQVAEPVTPIGLALADAEFDSERNHTYIRQQLRARSILPAKRSKKSWNIHGVRAGMRRAFTRRQYARRALLETVFSTVKRKPSSCTPGRSLSTQLRHAQLPGLTYNLYRL